MTNDGKARPLSVIIGERLKVFREERGLRQADLAAAAAALGLTWSRSSIAALEAGTRNLSLEEILIVPQLIAHAGGWEKPLISGDVDVSLPGGRSIAAKDLVLAISGLVSIIQEAPGLQEVEPEDVDAEILYLGEESKHDGELSDARRRARFAAWRAFLYANYPHVNYDEALSPGRGDEDLIFKIGNRLEVPDSPAQKWDFARFYPWALWGRPADEERDRRTAERGTYASKRSLQAARGHATREMITELSAEIARTANNLGEIFDLLQPIWGDAQELDAWAQDVSIAIAEHRRSNPVDTAGTIGDRLRRAREKADLSVEEISARTRMRVPIVNSIEQNDFTPCGGDVYARGHIRTLARAVGLDPHPLVEQYDVEHGGRPKPARRAPVPPAFPADSQPRLTKARKLTDEQKRRAVRKLRGEEEPAKAAENAGSRGQRDDS